MPLLARPSRSRFCTIHHPRRACLLSVCIPRSSRSQPPLPAPCSGPIRWRSSLKNTIYDVLRSKKEWQETDHPTEWDFFWADKG
jgi:hypothetical protein